MEEKILKLMAQLSLVALIAWLVASAIGNSKSAPASQPYGSPGGCGKRAGGSIWNNTPVQAPSAEEGLAFGWAPIL
jgi:hypothetical protein